MNPDTIFALATAPGRAGVAIVRISGPRARREVEKLAGPLKKARYLSLRSLTWKGNTLDQALVVWFREGASFTGEDMVELHLHGGRAVVESVLGALGDHPGLRMAEAGEFTRRALENGRMDLMQVEGLADLIDAETEVQRRQAMAVVEGRLSGEVTALREKALHALALLEASLDFADEDDAPRDVSEAVAASLRDMGEALTALVDGAEVSARLRDGFRVTLTGAPNVGKSSLINAIAGREVAITSEFAGTTRDVIEVQCDLGGLPVTFVDTAGLRETEDVVEAIGVERARESASASDLILHLATEQAERAEIESEVDVIEVWSKADLHPQGAGFAVSAVTSEGIVELLDLVRARLSEKASGASSVARVRQARNLAEARAHIEAALQTAALEIKSFELREALVYLDETVGRVMTEDVLGEIFSRFCMGK